MAPQCAIFQKLTASEFKDNSNRSPTGGVSKLGSYFPDPNRNRNRNRNRKSRAPVQHGLSGEFKCNQT